MGNFSKIVNLFGPINDVQRHFLLGVSGSMNLKILIPRE